MQPSHDADSAADRLATSVGGLFWRITALALLVPLALLAASAWWTWSNLESEARARVERVASTMEEQARRLIAVQETLQGGRLHASRGSTGTMWRVQCRSRRFSPPRTASPRRPRP